MQEKELNLVATVRKIKKWKKPLLIILVLSTVLAIIIAFTRPVYYESTALFIPLSPKAYDPKVMFSDDNTHDYLVIQRRWNA